MKNKTDQLKNKLLKRLKNFPEYTLKENLNNFNCTRIDNCRIRIHCPYCDEIKNVRLFTIFYKDRICGCQSKNTFLTYKKFLQKAKEIHGDKYDYSLITKEWWQKNYKTSQKTSIPIICPKHGLFYQKVFDHLQGHGCSKCNYSHGERILFNILNNFKIKFIDQYKINFKNRNLKFDFFLPNFNTFIEVDGIQHFKKTKKFESLKDIKERDFLKNKFCHIYKINLIRIPYWNLNNKDILKILKKYKIIKN